MAAIIRRSLDEPDESIEFEHDVAHGVRAGDSVVWRSILRPGWSWDTDIKPMAGGAPACPMTHREYVVAGSIHYTMLDGSEVTASAGDHLFIPPGHRAWVRGEEDCILIDW